MINPIADLEAVHILKKMKLRTQAESILVNRAIWQDYIPLVISFTIGILFLIFSMDKKIFEGSTNLIITYIFIYTIYLSNEHYRLKKTIRALITLAELNKPSSD